MNHWAAPLIGKRWKSGAEGPETFDCWGLVRWVQREQRGIVLPALSIGQIQTPEQLQGLYDLVRRSNWHDMPDGSPEKEFDIVLTRSREGPHVGVVIDVDRQLRVLHAVGNNERPGAVVHSEMRELRENWGRVKLWRHIESEEK